MTTSTHWPSPGVQFLSSNHYHSSLSHEARQYIQGHNQRNRPETHPQALQVRVGLITNAAHPAANQHGLFASKKIPPNTHIIDYIGKLVPVSILLRVAANGYIPGEVHSDCRLQSDYDLSLQRFQDGENVGIDASEMGNEARFVNDYRGIAERANAFFREYRATSGELRIAIWTGSRPINKGHEVLVSYGKAWWQARATAVEEHTVPDSEG